MTTPATPHPAAPVVKNVALDNLKFVDAEDGSSIAEFTGIASAVGVLDRHNEIIEKGAFDATLKADGPTFVMLYQHDPGKPIGVIHLELDAKGNLVARGEINLDTELGRETHSLMRQGALKSMSIGFNIPEGGAVWDAKAGVLRILAVELWEVSVVTFPANPGATVDSVKHAFGIGPDDAKAGRVLSKANRSKIESAIEALQATLDADTPPKAGEEPDPDASKSSELDGKAPTLDPVELAGVKTLIAEMRAKFSERESA